MDARSFEIGPFLSLLTPPEIKTRFDLEMPTRPPSASPRFCSNCGRHSSYTLTNSPKSTRPVSDSMLFRAAVSVRFSISPGLPIRIAFSS
jgi:hypothetical protein